MDFYFENAGIYTYLVYRVKEDDVIDSMSLGMLTNNKINGLAGTIFTQMDAEKYIKYNVSAKVSVRQFFTGAVNKARLLGVFNGIVNAMLSAEDYMIAPGSILLDLDYIFADVSTCETVLVCLPLQAEDESIDLGSFFKNIMFNTQFDQTENCDYVARIINYLNSVPVFSLNDFKSVIDELGGLASKVSQSPTQFNNNVNRTPNTVTATKTVMQPSLQNAPNSVQQVSVPLQAQPPVHPVQSVITKPVSINNNAEKVNVPPAPSVENVESESENGEKPMSFFYLIQHYNSENAAAYKAQKDSRKQCGESTPTPAPSGKKEKKSDTQKSKVQPVTTGFAIPGQATTINAPVQSPVKPISAQPVKPVQPVAPIQQPVVKTPVTPQPAVKQPVSITKQQSPFVSSPPQPIQGVNFGETTVLNGGIAGETTVLSASTPTARQINPYLIRAKNNERIPVNKPVFRIGKEKSYVDYFIGDNSAISRSHANIISRDGKYFVMDTNSTNHTYLDGSILQSNSEYEILHGSKIRFANEDFEFKLY